MAFFTRKSGNTVETIECASWIPSFPSCGSPRCPNKSALRRVASSLEAIRTVHAGRRYFPRNIAARLAERMMRTNLTARELEVLQMLARGLTNKQIGSALEISGNTVRNHVNSVIEKLEVSDRTEAATTAIHRGLIELNS